MPARVYSQAAPMSMMNNEDCLAKCMCEVSNTAAAQCQIQASVQTIMDGVSSERQSREFGPMAVFRGLCSVLDPTPLAIVSKMGELDDATSSVRLQGLGATAPSAKCADQSGERGWGGHPCVSPQTLGLHKLEQNMAIVHKENRDTNSGDGIGGIEGKMPLCQEAPLSSKVIVDQSPIHVPDEATANYASSEQVAGRPGKGVVAPVAKGLPYDAKGKQKDDDDQDDDDDDDDDDDEDYEEEEDDDDKPEAEDQDQDADGDEEEANDEGDEGETEENDGDEEEEEEMDGDDDEEEDQEDEDGEEEDDDDEAESEDEVPEVEPPKKKRK